MYGIKDVPHMALASDSDPEKLHRARILTSKGLSRCLTGSVVVSISVGCCLYRQFSHSLSQDPLRDPWKRNSKFVLLCVWGRSSDHSPSGWSLGCCSQAVALEL